jgi:hypothetical protein
MNKIRVYSAAQEAKGIFLNTLYLPILTDRKKQNKSDIDNGHSLKSTGKIGGINTSSFSS